MREDDEPRLDASNKKERRTLIQVLLINLSQVALAGIVGFLVSSTGLLGTALDSLADAVVYIVALYAVGRTAIARARAARISGIFLLVLGIALSIEIIKSFIDGGEPVGIAMIIVAIINSLTNWVCVKLLQSQRNKGAHIKASIIFTGNDMFVNLGIVLSGIAVMIFKSPIPDLMIGLIVVGISIKGGIEILKEANEETKK